MAAVALALAHPLLLPFSTIVAPSGGAAHALQRQGSSVHGAAAVEQCTLAVVPHFSPAETDVLVHFVFIWFVEAEADIEAKAEAKV